MNIHKHIFALEAGRLITMDGAPFVSLNYCVPGGENWNPCDPDEFARWIVETIHMEQSIALLMESPPYRVMS